MAAILVGTHFWRVTPDRPERPEREGRGPGGNRWFFGALGIFLLILVLGRFLGPPVVAVLWALGLTGYLGIRVVKALGKGRGPKP